MELFPIYEQNSKISPNIWYSVSGLGECPSMRVGHTINHYVNEDSTKGKLYIIGGANPSGSFNDVYTLDMDNLQWDKFDEMAGESFQKGRYEHSCLGVNQNSRFLVYVFGGCNEEGSLNDSLEFDFDKKSCSLVKPESRCVPSPRTCHVGANYKNQLVIFSGGETGKKPVDDLKLYLFNPTSRKWISLAIQGTPEPENRHGHVMISDDEMVYLHGGMNEELLFDDLWAVDLKKLTWQKIDSNGSRPCARAAHGGVCIDSAVFVFGGLAQTGHALDDLWRFDIASKQWSLVQVFGHTPPSRLDFGYCKMRFKINDNENDLQDEKYASFMVIHGGMDTEGNIFDDIFFIRLE